MVEGVFMTFLYVLFLLCCGSERAWMGFGVSEGPVEV